MSMMYVGYEAVKFAVVSNRPARYPAGKVANGPQYVVLDKARTVEIAFITMRVASLVSEPLDSKNSSGIWWSSIERI